MTKYYGQHGEDFLINKIFSDLKNGFFVEVGCIDGRLFSNTLSLEEAGWKGICIEAHKNYISLIKKNRPNSIVINAAIGESNSDAVKFYANSRGSLSTLDINKEKEFKKDYGQYFTGFEEQTIEKKTLTSVFKECNIKNIDLLSIDIEGYDKFALEGCNFKKYQPKLIVIEADSRKDKWNINKILTNNNYNFLFRISNNLFYGYKNFGCKKIKNNGYKNIRITHTQHPLDSGGEKNISKNIKPTFNLYKINIIDLTKKIKNKLNYRRIIKNNYNFLKVGFHGDKYLCKIALFLISRTEQFIETGANVGSTFLYVLKNFPDKTSYSCEPDKNSYKSILPKILNYKNAKLYNNFSPEFLYNLTKGDSKIKERDTVFWLDAHGHGYKWPLEKEIEFITKNFKSGYIFIDDFKVPDKPQFAYSEYENQTCSYEFIKNSINPKLEYSLYYPNYEEKTSKYHPLTGWGLIEFGHNEKNNIFSEEIEPFLKKYK